MPFRNYRHERAQKERVKDERKREKLRKRDEASLQRKSSRETEPGGAGESASADAPETAGG